MFEWDEAKRLSTIAKHGIDFAAVLTIFEGDHLIIPAKSDAEPRFAAVANWKGTWVTVIFTRRGETLRLITARRARDNERTHYHARYG